MEVEAAFPAYGEAFELVQEGEGSLDDVAQLAQAVDVGVAASEDDGRDAALWGLLGYPLSAYRSRAAVR
ncbi:hypothetical protein [Streptomyces sp. NBC_01262]|uniref:hypothetical protein n=1 Tax=Streptomyces sp. NBC_01262 TaxID=2903803 RepID=UPI003FCE13F4